MISVRKTLKFKKIHPFVHAHEMPHSSTPRINLVSPELSQSTRPSSPTEVWAWVRCWVTKWMWKCRHAKPALPQGLFTSDWERPKLLFPEMGKLFGESKKPCQSSFPFGNKFVWHWGKMKTEMELTSLEFSICSKQIKSRKESIR